MTEQKKLKLSKLDDEVEIAREDSWHILTVGQLKHEMQNLGEPHHKHNDWYTLKGAQWRPDAEAMIERHIELEADDMYEGWYDRAWDCINPEHIEKIQVILDQAFEDGHATNYWNYDQPVEIDILPTTAPKEGDTE